MKKKLFAVIIAGLIVLSGCGTGVSSDNNANADKGDAAESKEDGDDEISLSNADLKKVKTDFTIKDFDLDVSTTVDDGEETMGFTYKNNTDFTITSFYLTYKIKDDLSEDEKATILKWIDKYMDYYKNMPEDSLSDEDKSFIDMYDNNREGIIDILKEKREIEFSVIDDVAPGETSDTDTTYEYDEIKDFWSVFEPYSAEIEYKKGEDKTAEYNYLFKTKTESVEEY